MHSEPATTQTELTCSAKGCTCGATVELRWNNPKIHTPERRKIWLACPDHEDHLRSFLSARGFWRETVAMNPTAGDQDA